MIPRVPSLPPQPPPPPSLPLRAGVSQPCVETELTATKNQRLMATDQSQLYVDISMHKRAYDRIQLVADRKYPIAEIYPCSRPAT